MPKSTPPRPWLDEATATHLTESDLARLDSQFARWSDDHAASLGIDLIEYVRYCAIDAAKIRLLIGTDEIPLPDFAPILRFTEWALNEHETDAYRTVTGEYVDEGGLNATFEVDQFAISGHLTPRVHIEEGGTEDPDELRRWALALLDLAGQWEHIKEGQA